MNQPDVEFSLWLSKKLDYLKLDSNIYVSYISGMLEGNEPSDEKMETIASILSGTEEENILQHCQEIFDKWESLFVTKTNNDDDIVDKENVDQQFSRLLEQNARVEEITQCHHTSYTAEELKIREVILSQYCHADVADDDLIEEADEGAVKMNGVEKNINVSSVHQAEKDKREKAKIENQQKKVKDKEDREKQRLTAQDKKEARRKKAQKVERRRM